MIPRPTVRRKESQKRQLGLALLLQIQQNVPSCKFSFGLNHILGPTSCSPLSEVVNVQLLGGEWSRHIQSWTLLLLSPAKQTTKTMPRGRETTHISADTLLNVLADVFQQQNVSPTCLPHVDCDTLQNPVSWKVLMAALIPTQGTPNQTPWWDPPQTRLNRSTLGTSGLEHLTTKPSVNRRQRRLR